MEMLSIVSVLAVVTALALTVLIAIFILPEKKKDKLNKFFKFLHNLFNFKYLVLEAILKFLYVFATVYTIAQGFFMLFCVENSYWYTHWYGLEGLLLIVLGPIAIRIMYELLMLAVLLVKNVIQINNKLKNQNADAKSEDIFSVPAIEKLETVVENIGVKEEAPAPASVAAPSFCAKCGAHLDENGNCANCQ